MTVVSGTPACARPALLLPVLAAGVACAAVLAALGSCTSRPPAELVGDELFSLGIGPLDEQLDLVRVAGAPAPHATRMAMRDGLFYIANGNARKVMQLSSHGDLLLLIYDPESNPEPVGLASGGRGAATRVAVPHGFRALSHIAVDNQRRILVVDGQRVKRFAPDGRYLDAIGREGRNGAPFGFVERLTVMADDSLVVTARSAAQWVIYWYDDEGRPQDRLHLAHAGGLGDETGLVIRDLLPSVSQRRLLVFVEAWKDGEEAGSGVPGVRLFDAATRSVVASYGLPDAAPRRGTGGAGNEEQAGPWYHPLGVTAEGLLFLTRREDDRTRSLLVLGANGRVVVRRHWVLDETALGFVSLGMSDDGVLHGLLGAGDRARVMWWRGDLLVAER